MNLPLSLNLLAFLALLLGLAQTRRTDWSLAKKVLLGLALGIAVSMVLVHVVNPQSFHWTMDLLLPWSRLIALCASVVVAGTLTALLAGRAAVGQDAVMAVKEDW